MRMPLPKSHLYLDSPVLGKGMHSSWSRSSHWMGSLVHQGTFRNMSVTFSPPANRCTRDTQNRSCTC